MSEAPRFEVQVADTDSQWVETEDAWIWGNGERFAVVPKPVAGVSLPLGSEWRSVGFILHGDSSVFHKGETG